MWTWYLALSIPQRALYFSLGVLFCIVMYRSFLSLTGSHRHVTWYRGVHSTPVFQVLMWIGAFPLIVPAVLLYVRRRRKLATAAFIGNLRSRKFHLRDCEYQRKIGSDFLRLPLRSPGHGVELGFSPCNWCLSDRRGGAEG